MAEKKRSMYLSALREDPVAVKDPGDADAEGSFGAAHVKDQ